MAATSGVTTLALTDHDTTDGIDEAAETARLVGVNLIVGIELSTFVVEPVTGIRRGVHLLGYGFDHHDDNFHENLSAIQHSRSARNERLFHRLGELGVPVDRGRVHDIAGAGSVGRPHFAQALVEAGHVSDTDAAFTEFLGDGAPAWIPRVEVELAQAIALIHHAGGVASWAHPPVDQCTSMRELQQRFDPIIPAFVEAGIDGIEAWYPRFSPTQRTNFARYVENIGLIPTGGSDFHGDYRPNISLGTGSGDLIVPSSVVESLQFHFTNTK